MSETLQERHEKAEEHLMEGEALLAQRKFELARMQAEQAMQRMQGMKDDIKRRIRVLWQTTIAELQSQSMIVGDAHPTPSQASVPKAPVPAPQPTVMPLPATQAPSKPVTTRPSVIPFKKAKKQRQEAKEEIEQVDGEGLLRFMRQQGAFPAYGGLESFLREICAPSPKMRIQGLLKLLRATTDDQIPQPFTKAAMGFILAHKIIRIKEMTGHATIKVQLQMNDLLEVED